MNVLAKILTTFLLLIIGVSLLVVASTSTNSVSDISTASQTIDIGPAKGNTTRNITVNNENGFINGTGYQLNISLIGGADVLQIQNVYVLNARNGTSGPITVANYTVNASGFVRNATTNNWNTATFNWSYIYIAKTVEINTSYQFTLNTGAGTPKSDFSECVADSINYNNQTGTTLTSGTDYTYTRATGILTLFNTASLNSTAAGNTTTASYSYCQDGYVTLGWARTSLDTTIGLFGIALLAGAIAMAFGIMRDFGFI